MKAKAAPLLHSSVGCVVTTAQHNQDCWVRFVLNLFESFLGGGKSREMRNSAFHFQQNYEEDSRQRSPQDFF
jgi:hypothetical protein